MKENYPVCSASGCQFNRRKRILAFFFAVLFVLPTLAVGAIVIDKDDNGGAGYVETGSWHNSSASNEHSGQSRYANSNGATATFTPTITTTGTYRVSHYSAYWSSRDQDAPFTITHVNGSDTFSVNQRVQHSGFFQLGSSSFCFEAGTGGNVVVTRYSGGDHGSSTSADAVQFELVTAGACKVWDITASAGIGGSITPSGVFSVLEATDQSFSVSPDGGFVILDVEVDGVSVGAVANYTFTNVVSGHDIEVTFDPVGPFTISADSGAGGAIAPAGDTVVNGHGNQSYTITPDTGYDIADVEVDGASVGAVATYGFTDIVTNHDIEASFVIQTFTITATSSSNGTISPSGTVNRDYDSSQTYTMTADPGYIISDVKVDGASVGVVSSYSFASITDDHTIAVAYTSDPDALIVDDENSNNTGLNVYSDDGTFNNSGSSSEYLNQSKYTATVGGTAKWTPEIPTTGRYKVYVNYSLAGDRDEAALYTVTHREGADDYYENQKTNADADDWNYLGSFCFTSGTAGYVTVTRESNDPPHGGHTSADAVMWQPDSSLPCVNIINATAGVNGSISPSGSVGVTDGSDQSFTITPDSNHYISRVEVDGAEVTGALGVGVSDSYTFSNVTADHEIDAFFEPCTVTITSMTAGYAGISPEGTTPVVCGTAPSFVITPDTGYEADFDVRVDGVSVLGEPELVETTPGEVWTYTFPATDTGENDNHAISVGVFSLIIDNTPLDAKVFPAPALIMFVLDDSGSMDWEYITEGGSFFGERYIFQGAVDNSYSGDILLGADQLEWRSQWSGYNKMFYNPASNYTPWPLFLDASTTSPRSHPDSATHTLDLTDDYLDGTINVGVTIRNAHYYTWDDADGDEIWNDVNNDGNYDTGDEKLYLVNMVHPGTMEYYEYQDDGDNDVENGELVTVVATALPSTVVTHVPPGNSQEVFDSEIQNFANWYSFYRRRELTATAAISKVIDNMHGVKIGVYGINNRINEEVTPIPQNKTTLLNNLYDLEIGTNSTPLRNGISSAGTYFHEDAATGGIGASPYASAEDGGSCQQAFTIVMTDGYYNGSLSATVGNVDGATDGGGDSLYGDPFTDGASNTLADVAMSFYVGDLSSTLADQVDTVDIDSGFPGDMHQHMVTYGVSFGVTGNFDPEAYPDIYTGNTGSFPSWTSSISSDEDRIDDLYHAAVNGRGTFLSASDPEELVDSLLLVMQNIENRIGSGASLSVNGDELYESVGSTIQMFQTSYYSDGWIGDIKAYNVNTTTGTVVHSPLAWDDKSGADVLDDRIDLYSHTVRVIATSNGTSGVMFRENSLSVDQLAQLDSDVDVAKKMVNYLRGDSSEEERNGGSFRDRVSALGDLVNSRSRYEDGVLYVGGNDGMLHAFVADNTGDLALLDAGQELFAYVPNLVFDNLKELTDPNYAHLYYVDGTPYIKKIYGESTNTTLLVGGLNKGGKGYYCLDISNPHEITAESVLANRVKWEYPAGGTTDDDMGYSFSQAYIVKSNDTSINSGTDLAGYVVIFGNGYLSTNHHAVLYVLDPVSGTVLTKIDTGVGDYNGLSSPTLIDPDTDYDVDYVYAGDLKGNLWKFDLTDGDYNNWQVAYCEDSDVSSGCNGSIATPQPLFTAQDTGLGQAITRKPEIMHGCDRSLGGYMVIFGTGKYLGDPDFDDATIQTLYGVWDYGDDEDDGEYLGSFDPAATPALSNQLDSVKLLKQYVVFEGDVDVDDDSIDDVWLRVLSNYDIHWYTVDDLDIDQKRNPGGIETAVDGQDNDRDGEVDEADEAIAHAGWYFDLSTISKEKMVTDLMIRDGKLVAITFVPSEDPCGTGGFSIVHEIDTCTGGRLTEASFDTNGDGEIDFNDLIEELIDDQENPGGDITDEVPTTGKKYEGRLHLPLILRQEPNEIKYFSSSSGNIETMREQAEQRGVYYWKQE